MTYTEAGTSKYAQLGDVKLHYHDCGQGDALLLLHGGGPGAAGWSNFSRNIDEFARNWRVLVPDLPGYGKSGINTADRNVYGHYTTVLIQLLDQLGIDKAHIVGNSLGGGTAMKMALEAPDRVGSMILMGAGGSIPVTTPMPTEGLAKIMGFYGGSGPSVDKMRGVLHAMVYDSSLISEDLVNLRYDLATEPETIKTPPLRFANKPLEDLWRDDLDKLPHEVLIISGREDRIIPVDSSLFLLKLIPKARLVVLPHCGHWAMIEKAEEFNVIVSDFIKLTETA